MDSNCLLKMFKLRWLKIVTRFAKSIFTDWAAYIRHSTGSQVGPAKGQFLLSVAAMHQAFERVTSICLSEILCNVKKECLRVLMD